MLKKLLIVGLAVLTAACVPIPPEPPATSAPLQASEPLATSEQLADCRSGYLNMLPGQSSHDSALDYLTGHIDIVGVKSGLEGETLTVEFRFRDIPETLTFNKTGTSANRMEYTWEVSIDVDADPETGDDGFEYLLSAYHFVRPAQEGNNTEAPIGDVAEASVWEKQSGGIISSLWKASLEVSAETDTMILSGRIRGITPDSRLTFWTHEYLGDSDEVGCQVLSTSSDS